MINIRIVSCLRQKALRSGFCMRYPFEKFTIFSATTMHKGIPHFVPLLLSWKPKRVAPALSASTSEDLQNTRRLCGITVLSLFDVFTSTNKQQKQNTDRWR